MRQHEYRELIKLNYQQIHNGLILSLLITRYGLTIGLSARVITLAPHLNCSLIYLSIRNLENTLPR